MLPLIGIGVIVMLVGAFAGGFFGGVRAYQKGYAFGYQCGKEDALWALNLQQSVQLDPLRLPTSDESLWRDLN